MGKIKIGDIVKFHTPLPTEDKKQNYIVLEVIEDTERPRAQIQALNTNLAFTPINLVKLTDIVKI